jgi:hypothetical protein
VIRTGQQPCFDRLVVDLNGPVKGYTVGYVPAIIQDPTGYTIPCTAAHDGCRSP